MTFLRDECIRRSNFQMKSENSISKICNLNESHLDSNRFWMHSRSIRTEAKMKQTTITSIDFRFSTINEITFTGKWQQIYRCIVAKFSSLNVQNMIFTRKCKTILHTFLVRFFNCFGSVFCSPQSKRQTHTQMLTVLCWLGPQLFRCLCTLSSE